MFFWYGEDWIILKSNIIKSNKTKQKKREREMDTLAYRCETAIDHGLPRQN